VLGLAPGTEVAVAVDGGSTRYGRVHDITANTLTVWERHGADAIARNRIERVAVRLPGRATHAPGFLKTTITAAVISGILGAVVAATGENGATQGTGVAVFAIGTLAGAAIGASRAPTRQYEERLVYIRP
jgi:hypothetical protein